MVTLCIWLYFLLPYVQGNTEKTIFLGPSPVNVATSYPALYDLQLMHLSPDELVIRTNIQAEFPDNDLEHGATSWFILHNLTEGRRYEVRICWAATQPTAFTLEPYGIGDVFATPKLAWELSAYATTMQSDVKTFGALYPQTLELGMVDSVLLLRIIASADFYSSNHTMMKNVPPILVDLILDPFMLNLIPQSLLSTVYYIMAVAVVSWFMGKWISSVVRQMAAERIKQKHR